MTPAEERLRAQLSAALRSAMKGRDAVRISALRSLLAALDNASAIDLSTVPRPAAFAASAEALRRELSAQEVTELLAREIAERQAAAARLHSLGRTEQAERALAELSVLAGYVEHDGP
jgi:uncharacterized protein